MRYLVLAFVLVAGCGKEIGDACIIGADCDPNGQRQCDASQHEGYCTIQGCDYKTCPSESACIRFFTGQFNNKLCNPATEDATTGTSTDDCSLDELCDLEGHCVARSAEIRYCMRKCSSDSDCRAGYECRDLTLQQQHGGEPVLAPGVPVDSHAPKFCATKPAT